jgi:BMFP domain-containing protein YqiC
MASAVMRPRRACVKLGLREAAATRCQSNLFEEIAMRETRGNMFEDFSRLMTDAAEVAHGVRREAESVMRGQLERLLASMEIVTRDEFDAVKEMAARAREENEKLAKRIAALEAKLGESESSAG